MSDRDPNKLDAVFEAKAKAQAETSGEVKEKDKQPPVERLPRPMAIDVNYPDPTPLSQILRDVAKWSGLAFVMEPTANVKIQIFAAEKLPPHQAYELFLASLSVVGLRAVQIGKVVKVVPIILVVSA